MHLLLCILKALVITQGNTIENAPPLTESERIDAKHALHCVPHTAIPFKLVALIVYSFAFPLHLSALALSFVIQLFKVC